MTLFESMNVEAPEATVSPVVAAVDLPLFASALIREQHEAVQPEPALYVSTQGENWAICASCKDTLHPNGLEMVEPGTGMCEVCGWSNAGEPTDLLPQPTYDEMYAYLQAHYNHDRFAGRDGGTYGKGGAYGEYSKGLTLSRMADLVTLGRDLISQHDTNNGAVVWYTAQDVINFTRYQVDRSGTNPDSTNVATELIAVLGL